MKTNNNLTKKGFNLLNFESKLSTIFNSGKFVDSHITSVGESKLLNFYNFAAFQVEVVYDLVGSSVKAINCLKLDAQIEYYESDTALAS